MVIELPAPAKVNLCLHVVGRREDGYHQLVTRMQKLDLCDRVRIEATASGTIEIRCPGAAGVPEDDSNLAVRAARRFFQCAGPNLFQGLLITLTKRIPVAAGLGGGSSDGAAVLKGLNRLYGEVYSAPELREMSRPLGADFAFLVSDCSAALGTGIGDEIEPAAPLDDYHYLLVNPGIRVETRWVYDNYRLTKRSDNFTLCGSQKMKDFIPEALHNDLERVTIPRHPVIGRIKERLLELGAAGALMSGSGPTVFALFAREEDAGLAAASLARHMQDQSGHRIITAKAYSGV